MNSLRTLGFSLSVFAIACGGRAASPGEPGLSGDPGAPTGTGFRLADTVRPLRYDVDMTLVPTQDSFTGQVGIDLDVRAATRSIWLHGADMEILSAQVGDQPATAHAGDNEMIHFDLAKPVGPGKLRLTANYRARIFSSESDAVYREKEGDESYIYTQFEASDARRAFPCFDEPSFKVPWKLTIHAKKEHIALANTPIESETDEADGMKAVRFAESKPMPSYLVAFAVGPFDIVDAGTAGRNKTPIRIITPHGKAIEAKWAAESTPQIITALENYFDRPYPFEKLDSIAVPAKGGAMENPGLVTYGQPLILARPDEDTISRKRRYAGVCAHELAHMWFGDLVTTAWWDDIWLNEAFATWMGSKIIAGWKPEWDETIDRVAGRSRSMEADSLMTARRIRQPIATQDDIESAFDGITYGKGAAVITMFESWIGEDKFQKGIQQYMEDHAWGNATAADFLSAISAAAGRDVGPSFSTFLDQPGVPLVTVELRCGKGTPPELALSQQRYVPAGSTGSTAQTWQIPICVRWGAGKAETSECMVMTEPTAELALSGATRCPDWVQANDGMTGYYRVKYQGDLLSRLVEGGKELGVAERVGIVGDVRALVSSGDTPYGTALALVAPLSVDKSRHLVSSALALAGGVSESLVTDEKRPQYARFIRKTFGGRAKALGFRARKADDDNTRLLRPQVVGLVAADGEDPALVKEAGVLARRWFDDHTAVDPDMVELVLSIAARNGDRALFDRFHAAAKATTDRKERGRMLRAMASFRDPEIAKAALAIVLADEFDFREASGLYSGYLAERTTRETAYAFVKANVNTILGKLPRAARTRLVAVGSVFCDEQHRKDVEGFFAPRAQSARTTAQVLERIGLCAAAKAAHEPSVSAFLDAY